MHNIAGHFYLVPARNYVKHASKSLPSLIDKKIDVTSVLFQLIILIRA